MSKIDLAREDRIPNKTEKERWNGTVAVGKLAGLPASGIYTLSSRDISFSAIQLRGICTSCLSIQTILRPCVEYIRAKYRLLPGSRESTVEVKSMQQMGPPRKTKRSDQKPLTVKNR